MCPELPPTWTRIAQKTILGHTFQTQINKVCSNFAGTNYVTMNPFARNCCSAETDQIRSAINKSEQLKSITRVLLRDVRDSNGFQYFTHFHIKLDANNTQMN